MKKTAKKKLTAKEEKFCHNCLIHQNKAQAAIDSGYSPKYARQVAYSLTKKKRIADRIAELTEAQKARLEISADSVIRELAKVAFVDVRKIFSSEDGSLKDITLLEADTAAALASVQTDEITGGNDKKKKLAGYTKKIKLWDKVKALELIGKHFKMFTDVVEKRDGDFLAKMQAARERKEKAMKK